MITIKDITVYQEKMKKVKANGFKANEYKALGRELQEKFFFIFIKNKYILYII